MITRTVVLACPPTRAFSLFTERAGEWWPADRRHTKDPASTIRVEKTGRFYERATDGKEVELGIVRAWEDGKRLLLDWYPGTSAAAPTHVEIRFEPEGAVTRVTIEHRPGAAGELYSQRASRFEESWTRVFAAWELAARA
jgi:hypothetical protein